MAAPVFEKHFTQDIRQKVEVRHCGDLMFTGDALSDTISVSLYDGVEVYAVSGTVTCNVIRADGATVPVEGTSSGNTMSATLTAMCFEIPGPLIVIMKITSGDTTTTVLKAVYTVDVGETGTIVDPGTIIQDVTALIAAIDAAVASIPEDYSDLLATIAPTFSSSTAYAIGDYVWYDGDLYRFTSAHAAGSWTGMDVESVATAGGIGGEVSGLKRDVSGLTDGQIDGERYVAQYKNTTTTSIGSAETVFVKNGDIVTINPGSYSCKPFVYAGTLDESVLLTEVNAPAITETKQIYIYVDGFIRPFFYDATHPSVTPVNAAEFDGSIKITSYSKRLMVEKAGKQDFDDLADGYHVTHANVLDYSDLVSTKLYWAKLTTNALTLSTASAAYNSYLIPVDGESVYTFKFITRYVFPVASDRVTALANAIENVTSIDTSQYSGCAYLAVSVNNNTYDMTKYCVSKGSTASKENAYTYPAWFNGKFDPLEGRLDDLEDDLEAFEDGYEVVQLNLLEGLTPTSTTQYYSKSTQTGKLNLSTASTTTYNSWIVPVDGTSTYTMSYITRYIWAVAADGQTVIGNAVQNGTSIDTSQYVECAFIAISVNNITYNMATYYVSRGNVARTGTETHLPEWLGNQFEEIEDQIGSLDVKPLRNKIYMLTDTSFSAEKNFSDFKTSAKAKGLHIVVNPTSFTSVTVGLRDTTRAVFYAQVTSDSVYLYDYNGGGTAHTQTYTHGLTIGDNLSIDVYAAPNTGAYYVRVGTNGTEYVTPNAFNVSPIGLIYPYASMEGAATFVQFSADCNTQRPIWLFGDSYLGTNNQARWAYYLVGREMDSRVMLDAYAGESSTAAYASLEALIECGVPDYIVWCLGMNDGGDTGTTPNTTWLGIAESVIALCEANNITPIFATIPSVPSVNNEGKNKWVRESGYQYIDFAKAVGASDQGVWFDGMLSNDNVHPSVTGAITLYHAALAGCPQFSQK